jgi:ParB family chromosome partitioning protein
MVEDEVMASALTSPPPVETPAAPLPTFDVVPWASIQASPLNPRQRFDRGTLEELAASMAGGVGIIEPLIVRPFGKKAGAYELVAGERRWRAAEIAGLSEVPVLVKPLTDVQVLELMVIENNQREDINALEEAKGFHALRTRGVDIAHIQARIGRSRKYVYDRLKLLDLVPAAKALLLEERITAGHAILLARLTKAQQEKAITVDDGDARHPLFVGEESCLSPAEDFADGAASEKDPYVGLKARSVRELDAWIAEHCRFDPAAAVNRELFPDTVSAVEEAVKVIHITRNHYTQPDAKDGSTQRIYHSASWKPADGRPDYDHFYGRGTPKASKTCDRSVLGLVVAGRGRGEAFQVCVDKVCDVHWKTERLAREKASTGGSAQARYKEQQAREAKRREAEEAREKRARAAWSRARPAIVKAFADKLKTVAVGPVADVVAKRLRTGHLAGAAAMLGGQPKTADDWLRHLVLSELLEIASSDWWGPRDLPRYGKAFGVDVAKVLKAAAVQTSAPDAPAKASAKKATKKR